MVELLSFTSIVKQLSSAGIEYRLRDREFSETSDVRNAWFVEIALGRDKRLQSFYLATVIVKDSTALAKSSALQTIVSRTATLEVPTCPLCSSTAITHRDGRFWCLNCNTYAEGADAFSKSVVSFFYIDTQSSELAEKRLVGDTVEVVVEGSVAIPRVAKLLRSFDVIYTATEFEFRDVVEKLGLKSLARVEKLKRSAELEEVASRLGVSRELVAKLLEVEKEKRIAVRLTKATEDIVNAVVEKFKYLKNFAVESSDLGLHCFDGRRWRECEGDVKTFIETVYAELKLKDLGIKYQQLLKEVLARLEDRFRNYLKYESSKIAFENCVFDWESLRCTEHSPEEIVFHYIPHEIDTDVLRELLSKVAVSESDVAKHTPRTLKAFKEWAREKWVLLYELVGFVLYPKPYKKAVLLIDEPRREGDTGKSTYIKFLQTVLGKENYTNVPLQLLVNPDTRFVASHIYKKLANLYADLPEKAVSDVGTFKVLTGGDSIVLDRKFREPFSWTPYTKHIFSANVPPPVPQSDDAFWRRWLVVEFYGDFAEKVRDFEKQLASEIPKAIAVGIALFARVLQRGFFSFENTERDAKHLWLSRSDSVYAFMSWAIQSGALVRSEQGKAWVSDLYEVYVKYCEYTDRDAKSQAVFTKRLRELKYSVKKSGNYTYLSGYALDREKAREVLEKLGSEE